MITHCQLYSFFFSTTLAPTKTDLTYICLITWTGCLCAALTFTFIVGTFIFSGTPTWLSDTSLIFCMFIFPGVEKATREFAVTSFCPRPTPSCLIQVSPFLHHHILGNNMAHRLRKWRCYILSFRVNVSFCKKTFKKCNRRYCSCWPWFYDFLLQSLSSAA